MASDKKNVFGGNDKTENRNGEQSVTFVTLRASHFNFIASNRSLLGHADMIPCLAIGKGADVEKHNLFGVRPVQMERQRTCRDRGRNYVEGQNLSWF